MVVYYFDAENITVWSYRERLVVSMLLGIVKSVFPHRISARCLHLKGPAGVKTAIDLLQKACSSGKFHYYIRADVKSYYASIDRKRLTTQVEAVFDDARLLGYLNQVINIAHIYQGAVMCPRYGIPRRSSLSPFFGALYLSELDSYFEKAQGVYYVRFMDDWIILCETKRQYLRAKKKMQIILGKLRLKLSPHKTKMGALNKGFHFLGVDFALSQNVQSKTHVCMTLNKRSCQRALDEVSHMKEGAVNPADIQSYLSRWAMWWSRTVRPLSVSECVIAWVLLVKTSTSREQAALSFLGSGLLLRGAMVASYNPADA